MPSTVSRRNFLSLDFGERTPAGDHWVKIHRLAMACRVEITLSSEDAGDVPAAREALDEADRLEGAFDITAAPLNPSEPPCVCGRYTGDALEMCS